MPRRYRHIREYEKQIYELKEKELTNREIAGRFYYPCTISGLYSALFY